MSPIRTPRHWPSTSITRRYGTFAEIGAGQEVVRWFFRVGGAAGHDRQEHVGLRHDRERRHLRQVRALRLPAAAAKRCSTTSTS